MPCPDSYKAVLRPIPVRVSANVIVLRKLLVKIRLNGVNEGPENNQTKFSVDIYISGDFPEAAELWSWPHLIDALLRTFIADEFIRVEYKSVARTDQYDQEDVWQLQ